MKIKISTWLVFFALALISTTVWYKFSYPQLAFVQLEINRDQALSIAKEFLTSQGADPNSYRHASVLTLDKPANRYLQRAVGFDGLKKFTEDNDFDMFFWLLRFFKEGEKEGYNIVISSSSGEVIGYNHIIEETTALPHVKREAALSTATNFLEQRFNIDLEQYTLTIDSSKAYDNRTDFNFGWQKKSVEIPWSENPVQDGFGKLFAGAMVSGNTVLYFTKNSFKPPEAFNRDIKKRKNISKNISTILRPIYLIIFTFAVYLIISRKNHLAMHLTKRFYIGVGIMVFAILLIGTANQFQTQLMKYSTTDPYKDFVWRHCVAVLRQAVVMSVAIIIPALAGELLRFQNNKEAKHQSLLYYVQSTFFSRAVAGQICFAYLICIILLGLQALIIKIGQNHLGVWVEHSWMENLSTAYWPFFAALAIGFKASVSEEIMYRLFGINWAKWIFRNTILGVIIISAIWGFAHSGYPVFPMWFRGIEVTILGLFIAFIYLRFGLIVTLTAHFLFNAFWNSAGFLFGSVDQNYFIGAICVLMLPLAFAVIAYLRNQNIEEKPMKWRFTKPQLFNLEILKYYLVQHPNIWKGKSTPELIKEISKKGWDLAVVEEALKRARSEGISSAKPEDT